MKSVRARTLAPVLVLAFASLGLHPHWMTWGTWDVFNDPGLIKTDYLRTWDALPLQGGLEAAQAPWSDSYWPDNRGGIAYRWFAYKKGNFWYKSPLLERARRMDEVQLAELSPAEKYDLFMGNYDYPTVKDAWHRSHWRDEGWEGICHGWSAASVLYPEPAPVTLVNADGIVIPFGSSDVKALLSYYYAWYAGAKASHVGLRCDQDLSTTDATPSPSCDDSNAGAFHIVLANQLGLRKQAFVIDVERGPQVWNQPVFAYSSTVLREDEAAATSVAGTAKRVLVSTTIRYAAEVEPQWEPLNGTAGARVVDKTYSYWLELNASGEIIGGDWDAQERPDFIWLIEAVPFEGPFAGLSQIYRPAVSQLPEPGKNGAF